MLRLTSEEKIEAARRLIAKALDAHGEWFVREGPRGRVAAELKRGEWELRSAARALVFSYWGASGLRVWRIAAWGRAGEHLRLEASRRMGAERATLELIPRASHASAKIALNAARLAVCGRLAALLAEACGLRVEEARLSAGARRGEPGRDARLLLRSGTERTLVAATAPVVPVGGDDAERFLTSALLWLARLEERGARIGELWLVAGAKLAGPLGERIALLREDLRQRILLFEVNEESNDLRPLPLPRLPELLSQPAPRLFRPMPPHLSELVESIVALAPEAIDVVRARHGQTLRFHGLPFARVRHLAGRELLWFGVGPAARRQLLEGWNREELLKLLAELAEHRRHDAADRRHHFYRAAPEAWLESILRRDIRQLDPGLRLAPLHTQFRTARGASDGPRPVDLLALRRDGRLALVELKVSEDPTLVLQAADYWRRVETHRRQGTIARARLFDDQPLAAAPPLLYLAAPLLRFHRSLPSLARALSPEIETYRFDLNEDWRTGVRVARISDLT
jgi:hypothetical protein